MSTLRVATALCIGQLACVGRGNVDGETATTDSDLDESGTESDGGDDGVCSVQPGSVVGDGCAAWQLVDGLEAHLPGAGDPEPMCSTGWFSDAPIRPAEWMTMVPNDDGTFFPVVEVLGAGAVLATAARLRWFGEAGELVATVDHGFCLSCFGEEALHVREADGHVFLAGADDAGDLVIREFADGMLLTELPVSTPEYSAKAAALFPFGSGEWLIVGAEPGIPGEYIGFVMRANSSGDALMYAPWPIALGDRGPASISASALELSQTTLLVGGADVQILDPLDGALLTPNVLGDFNSPGAAVHSPSGSGFVVATSDPTFYRIDELGVETLWTQTYDRAMTYDWVGALATWSGGYVAGGEDEIWWDTDPLHYPQPMLLGFDELGTAQWIGRLAIEGGTRSVAVAADGRVIAGGRSATGCIDEPADVEDWLWIAGW